MGEPPMPLKFSHPARASCRAFTLIEMLVVIGIIVLVASIAIPVTIRAQRKAKDTRMALELQAIGVALEAYQKDHGGYPEVLDGAPPNTGADVLGRALIGPLDDDLKPGPGFRNIAGAKAYGPYLQPDRYTLNPAGLLQIMNEKDGQPILYYPASPKKPNITLPSGYLASAAGTERPLYDYDDNAAVPGIMLIARMQQLMGDLNGNGGIDVGEKAAFDGPYILWTAGRDNLFGFDTNPTPLTDDIANVDFDGQLLKR